MGKIKFSKNKIATYIVRGFIVIGILTLGAYIGLRYWLSTWATYKHEELGFSFKYPKEWYFFPEAPPTDFKIGENGYYAFYVYKDPEVPYFPQDPTPSPGGVSIAIEIDRDQIEILKKSSRKYKETTYGDVVGYTEERSGGRCGECGFIKRDCCREWIYWSKSFFLKQDYTYYVNTITIVDPDLPSRLKGSFYHWIGTKILDSFVFTK